MTYGTEEHDPYSTITYEVYLEESVSGGQCDLRFNFFPGPNRPSESEQDAFFQKILTALSETEGVTISPDTAIKRVQAIASITP